MPLRSALNALSGFLLLFFFGLSLPGRTQNCSPNDPTIGRVNPTGDMLSPTVTTYCAGSSIGVFFGDFSAACPALGLYNPGNQYVLEMSDANGSFAAPTTLITSNFPIRNPNPSIVSMGCPVKIDVQ